MWITFFWKYMKRGKVQNLIQLHTTEQFFGPLTTLLVKGSKESPMEIYITS